MSIKKYSEKPRPFEGWAGAWGLGVRVKGLRSVTDSPFRPEQKEDKSVK